MGRLNSGVVTIGDVVQLSGSPIAFVGVAGQIRPNILPGRQEQGGKGDFIIPLPPGCQTFPPQYRRQRRQ